MLFLDGLYKKKTMQIEAVDRIAQFYCFPLLKTVPVCRTGGFRSTGKRVFWQTVINDESPKLKMKLNGIEIEGLLDSGADVPIIFQESWNPNWPLQRVSIQFSGIGTVSDVRQNVEWVKCIGPEG